MPIRLSDRAEPIVDVKHLRLIAAIAARGSVTAASRTLGLTQPALSHQLRELERRLRTPLFVRTARRMVPTPAGEQLGHVAVLVLAEIDRFEAQARAGEFTTARGTIRLATHCYTAYHWLPTLLQAFQARWPGVNLSIVPEFTADPVSALRNGALDVAILLRAVTDKKLRFEPLFDDELVVVTPPGHPLASLPFVDAEHLRDEHLILYSTDDGDTAVLRELLIPAGVMPRQLSRIPLTEAIIQLVSAGVGVSVLARWAIEPSLNDGRVRAVRLTAKGLPRKWFAAYRADDPAPAYLFDLVSLLKRRLVTGPVALRERLA